MSNVIGFSLENDSSKKEIENRRWSCSEAAVNDVVDPPTQTRKILDMDTLVVIVRPAVVWRSEKQEHPEIARQGDDYVPTMFDNFSVNVVVGENTINLGLWDNAGKTTFLICMVHKLGYGNWDELKEAFQTSPLFRFDWFGLSILEPLRNLQGGVIHSFIWCRGRLAKKETC
ncbi:hypothetical protein L6452_25563 [Arctium lappa]|uniref:Uncharacterized protein n=1 Tax=Arctium lappa TaxID=4217 RepID=A0ACB9ABK2_ARCLA|nr:hypothetical protein L6452_25563 [Arctium lappa]